MILQTNTVLCHKSYASFRIILKEAEVNDTLWLCEVYDDTRGGFLTMARFTSNEIKENYVLDTLPSSMMEAIN